MNWSQLTVFDLDRTMVVSNSSMDFCHYLVQRKFLPYSFFFYSLIYGLRHSFLGMNLVQLHAKVFEKFLKGKSLKHLEDNIEPFLYDHLRFKIYPPVMEKLRLAKQLGHYTLILSSSPSFLVEKIAAFFGVNEWRATEYAVDKERNFCHIASIMQGEEKALCVQEIAQKLSIAKENITAYSDSFLDLPLLRVVGAPFAVNPDRDLLRFSKAHKWPIL